MRGVMSLFNLLATPRRKDSSLADVYNSEDCSREEVHGKCRQRS